MRRSVPSLARLGAVALTTSVVMSLAIVGAASAATSGVVTVTGGSVSKIEVTIPDATAAFGLTMTPDGDPSGSESNGINVVAAGACYEWAGSVAVRSNVSYGVTLSAAAANNRLDFLTADPGTYAACTGGTQVSTSTTTWATTQGVTSSRSHPFWLGVDVQWTDAPSATLANATLTLTAVAGL